MKHDLQPAGYQELTLVGRFEPVSLAARLARAGISESYVLYEHDGVCRLAAGALGEVTVDRGRLRTRWRESATVTPLTSEPLRQVGAALAAWQRSGWDAYGWIAFELALPGRLRRSPAGASPLLHLIVPHTDVRLEPGRVRVRSVRADTLELVRELLTEPCDTTVPPAVPVDVTAGADGYRSAVAAAVGDIRQGLLQKVILSRSVPVAFPVDFAGTYLRGRAANTAARSFVLDLGGRRAVGFSPETIVEVAPDGRVATQPLAGTRALGLGDDVDGHLRDELLHDPKEVFEHAISVKLAHDELVDACVPGSVAVQDLMTVRPRGSVQHLGSTVVGQLRGDRTAWDALAALFPAVTASGIPKAAAYECIARLEDRPRGLYAGAVLTASSDGAMDASLVLRTLFEEDGRAWLRAGAGIVAGSRPEREYEETCEKLRSIAPHVVAAPSGSSGAARSA